MKNAEEVRWFIFYCSSRAEKKIAEQLQKSGYRVFLPVVTTLRQWSDRKKKVKLPLFPGYIFVAILERQISAVRQFPGIVAPLYDAKQYGCLKQTEVDSISRIIEFGTDISAESTAVPGDWVIIEEGPLKGLQGMCISQENARYLVVQIESLNQYIKAKIHATALRVIPKN